MADVRTQGSLAASGQSAATLLGRSVDISLSGSWVGTVKLQRNMSSGWQDTGYSWTTNVEATISFATMMECRLDFTRTSGTLVYDMRSDPMGSVGASSSGSFVGGSGPASKVTLYDTAGVAVDFSGITTIYRVLSAAASTNAASIKASAGRYYWIRGRNNRGTSAFIKIYNKASAPTVGTDTPVDTIEVIASQPFVFDFPAGVYLATGIAIAMTTAGADADTGALTAADITGFSMGYA